MTAPVWIKSNALPVFLLLQCLDALTTLVFLSIDVAEGNPLVGMAMSHGHDAHAYPQWIGLVAAKLVAMIVGYCCYRSGRMGALRLANAGYSVIVGWNVFVIAVTALARM